MNVMTSIVRMTDLRKYHCQIIEQSSALCLSICEINTQLCPRTRAARYRNMLIGGSALLGLASGPPACYSLLTGELVSNKYKMIGTIVVVVPIVIATGFAPYIGQRLVYVASWRWIYYLYLRMINMCII
jgi:MFS family permease